MTARPLCLTTLVAVAIALTVPGMAGAAPGFGNSVTGSAFTCDASTPGAPPCLSRSFISVDVWSNTSGLTGSVTVASGQGSRGETGHSGLATCIATRGRTAIIGTRGQHYGIASPGDNYPEAAIIRIVDGGSGPGLDSWGILATRAGEFGGPLPAAFTDCRPFLRGRPASASGHNEGGDLVVSSGAPVGDSVSTKPGRFLHRATINATSGPSGNHPSGLASWHIGGGLGESWSGRITCLNVTGKTALVGFTGQLSSGGGFFHYWVAGIIRIVDNGPPAGEFGFSVDDFSWSYDLGEPGPEFELPAGEPIPGPTDCSTFPGDWEVTAASGLASDDDLIVTDHHNRKLK
jgi:hypothetical protein